MELFSAAFAPFTVSLIVMLAIGAIELLGLVAGFSPSGSIESALPEIDIPDAAPPEIPGVEAGIVEVSPLAHVLGWFSVGRVPVLVLLVIALTSFGLAGYLVQWTAQATAGAPIHAGLAAIPALIASGYCMRWLGRWLERIFPRDHSEAASQNELIGAYATIIRGTATQGQPAEAKTTDLRGRTHYVLLEPNDAKDSFGAGQRVFITGRSSNVYRAVTKIATPDQK